MSNCPSCKRKLKKPYEDEPVECDCGWSAATPYQCRACHQFFADDEWDEKEGMCYDCVQEMALEID
jgi:DNA-directed RNA polymerase subunit RPC12/RpoP